MAVDIASFMSKPKMGGMKELEEEEEPISRQLEILMERRRQEEIRKARYHWSLLRNSIRNTIAAVQEADVKGVVINHGIHPQRKLNHESDIKQVIFIRELKEYLTMDGKAVRLFLEDGRKKKTYTPEEPMDRVSYCSKLNQFVGRITGGDELFLMNSNFEIISQSRAPSEIVLADYNASINEFVTVGPGYFVTWAFRYGARHLIPRKMNKTDFKEDNMFTHMVLESTASRSQKIYLAVGNGVACYNVFEGTLLSYKNDLHERLITAMTYFNPLKYLATGAMDGTIKIWDGKWHVMMVFVGHTATVNALDVYPHGSAIVSASHDRTVRVWNLDTRDEVDRAQLDEVVDGLQTTLDYDVFFTHAGRKVNMWRLQHIYHIHTSVGQRVVKIKHTSHPNYSTRSVVISRDASVRLVSPGTGEVITTLLLNPKRSLVDVAYAIEDEVMFTVQNNGDILKVRTDTNPCQIVSQWKCSDPETEACNYLLVYEYVVEINLKKDTWKAVSRGVNTKAIDVKTEEGEEEQEEEKKPKKNVNRTLLLGGRKDGSICMYNWETGKVEFKIDAHGSKGVMSLIANAKVDQLISAGKDNFIKVWRVYPFVQEALAPLMSFFCAHLPLHMTMIKTNLCVAFQDHATATYSIVMYNLRDRNRFDHEPGDDHSDAITGITSCPRMKLYASASIDGTIRIWNETNTLVRLLRLKSVPYSIGFCSPKGDLLIGIGDHMYKINHYSYLPKAYMFRMVSMKFYPDRDEKPITPDNSLTQKLSKSDIARLKNSHSSFKFDTYTDVLSVEEEEEINREKRMKDKEFNMLKKRDDELLLIRDGDLISGKKPKSTKFTKSAAFKNYMKMYYNKEKPTIPIEDRFPDDTVKTKLKEPQEPEREQFKPEREPTGFFPPASEAVRQKSSGGTPLQPPYPITPSGFIPNSILVKLLWPQETKARLEEARRKAEWKLPTFSLEQLEQISKSKKKEDAAVEEGEERQVTFDEGSDRVLEMDWDDEPEERTSGSPTALESDRSSQGREKSILKKEKSKEDDKPKSALMDKFASIITTPPPEDEAERLAVPGSEKSSLTTDKSEISSKQPSDLTPRPPPQKREVKPKQIVKFIAKPPPSPPKPKEPPARKIPTPVTEKPTPRKPVEVVPEKVHRHKTPSPPPKPPTPVPSFITQFKGVAWFEKFFQTIDEKTLPKPWTVDNFVTGLIKLIRVAEYNFKVAILEAILMMHVQDELPEHVMHAVCKTLYTILNNEKDPPTCMIDDQRSFIVTSLKTLHKMGGQDKEVFAEMLVQFLDGDKEVRATVQNILTSFGLQDPHRCLSKELDSWDIWNIEEDDRKADLRKMCLQWLDRWMTSYKLHLEDAIERLKKGQNIHGRMSQDQYKKRRSSSTPPPQKSILRRSVGIGTSDAIQEDQETITTLDGVDASLGKTRGVTVTFDRPPDPALIENATFIDAMNYFCDMMLEKEMEAMRVPGKRIPGSKENVVQAKNTVLVLPKLPHKPCLVRLGETHTSQCRAHRETSLQHDYRLPPMTARGYHPLPGQINGFVNSINLPLKPVNLNPFPCPIDEKDLRFQEPILITLRSAQKYFIPTQSVVQQEAVAAAL